MRLVGRVGSSFLDFWSLAHFGLPLILGMDFESQKWSHALLFPLVMVGAFLWEVLERRMEKTGVPFRIEKHEGPWNRWVSDPLMAVIGYWFGVYGVRFWT